MQKPLLARQSRDLKFDHERLRASRSIGCRLLASSNPLPGDPEARASTASYGTPRTDGGAFQGVAVPGDRLESSSQRKGMLSSNWQCAALRGRMMPQ